MWEADTSKFGEEVLRDTIPNPGWTIKRGCGMGLASGRGDAFNPSGEGYGEGGGDGFDEGYGWGGGLAFGSGDDRDGSGYGFGEGKGYETGLTGRR